LQPFIWQAKLQPESPNKSNNSIEFYPSLNRQKFPNSPCTLYGTRQALFSITLPRKFNQQYRIPPAINYQQLSQSGLRCLAPPPARGYLGRPGNAATFALFFDLE
jgi:hypothetical protein